MSIGGIDGAGGGIGPGAIRPSQAHEIPDVSKGNEHQANGRSAPTGDRVEISAEARALSAANVAPTNEVARVEDGGGMTAERLQTVLTRMRDGFYESPQARETTAQNLLPDLRTLSH